MFGFVLASSSSAVSSFRALLETVDLVVLVASAVVIVVVVAAVNVCVEVKSTDTEKIRS